VLKPIALALLAAIAAAGQTHAADLLSMACGGATFAFDPAHGGRIAEVALKAGPPLARAGERAAGEWEIALGLGDRPDETWTAGGAKAALVARREGRLRLEAAANGLRLIQTCEPWAGSAGVVEEAWLVNERGGNVVVGRATFGMGPISLGGHVEQNEYVYPPGVFQHLRGPVAEALPGPMGQRHIYGCLQQTDKLMLPLAAIWDDTVGVALALACRNDEAAVRVGVIGGDVGRLQATFGIYRQVPPGGRLYLGKVAVGLWRRTTQPASPTAWAAALAAYRRACVAGGIVETPKTLPPFTKDLQIAWIGPYCAPYATFDDIRARLPAMAAGGINALIVGGRLWYCRNSARPELPDFLPILRNGGYTVDDTVSGGEAGLRRLIDEGHRLRMKVFCWGPTLAGVALESPEVAEKPDWWIRRADGQLNLWYSMLAPPDASVEGWRDFVLDTVRRISEEYRFDGCWLDSTWKDHALNLQSRSGWYGGPNGAKVSLLREIRALVKSLNPDFVLMAESGGAETASAVDLWYVRSLGVFPLVPPERMQEVVMTEEACRLPGVRPFGQLQVDPGPLGETHPTRRALLLPDSWKATLFLNSTLPRVPAYFVGNPLAGLLDQPELGQVTRRLLVVRRCNRELVDGEVVFEGVQSSAPPVVRFCRVAGRKASLVLVNCSAEPVASRITLSGSVAALFPASESVRDLLEEAVVGPLQRSADGRAVALEVTLPGYRGAILQPSAPRGHA